MRPKIIKPKSAEAFITKTLQILKERGKENGYDKKEERSFKKIASVCSIILGKEINADDIALILLVLKLVRQFQQDRYHQDSAEDAIAYAAFIAEERFQRLGEKDAKEDSGLLD